MISSGFTWGSWTQKAKLVASVWQYVSITLIRGTKGSSSIINYTALVIQRDLLLIPLLFRHLHRQLTRIERLYWVQEWRAPWQIDEILSWVRSKQHFLICLLSSGRIFNLIFKGGSLQHYKEISSTPDMAFYSDGKAQTALKPTWRKYVWRR